MVDQIRALHGRRSSQCVAEMTRRTKTAGCLTQPSDMCDTPDCVESCALSAGSFFVPGMQAAACVVCDPSLKPIEPRMGEFHFSVHLGDHQATALLDGERIHDCVEMVAGPGGWAVRFCLPPMLCPCGSHEFVCGRDFSDGYSISYTKRYAA